MKVLFRFRLTVLAILFTGNVFSAELGRIYIYVDSNSRESIHNADNFPWKEVELNERIFHGYNENATVWCKLIPSTTVIRQKYYWTFNNIHLDSLIAYKDSRVFSIQGDRTKGKSEYLNAYTIDPSDWCSSGAVCIVAVKKQLSFVDFSISLNKRGALLEDSLSSFSLFYAFIGFALLLLSLNAYIYWQTHKNIYVYYIGYSLIGIVYVAVNMGVAKYRLFPNFLYFSEFRIFSGFYWFMFLGIFIGKMLNFKESSPFINRLLVLFQWVVALLSIFTLLCFYFKAFWLLFIPSYVAYLLFFGNIVLLAFGIYKAFKIRHSRVNYVIFSFAPHILWALNLILAAFELVDVLFSKNWLSMIILYEMFLFGWILIKEYVDSFKHVQLLQEKVIAEEKRTIFEIEQTRIQERKMIANILHDKVGVNLARSVHLLELKRYDDVLSLIKNTGVYIRNLSHRILPKSLEMGALSASLKEQIEHLNGEYKDVLIQFDSYDFPENISQERAISLYLIALELIQNALKHASADQIVLELFYYPNAIVMSCTDDGVGSSEPFNYGFGLSTINRRIVDQGGRLDISTDRQTGTCVLVEFPL